MTLSATADEPTGWPNYHYGEKNTVKLWFDPPVCVTKAVISLEYTERKCCDKFVLLRGSVLGAGFPPHVTLIDDDLISYTHGDLLSTRGHSSQYGIRCGHLWRAFGQLRRLIV